MFVLASLAVWVLRPLPWLLAATAFAAQKAECYPRRGLHAAQFDALTADPAGSEIANVANLIRRLKTAYTFLLSWDLRSTTSDAVVLTAFARKFFVSLAHVAVLFALIHFAINLSSIDHAPAYTDLAVGPLPTVWGAYGYFAAMTLIAGATNVAPITSGAHVAVLLNAFVGVGFLVVLVTTFSMVARDHVRDAVSEITDRVFATTRGLEERIINFIVPIARLRPLPRDAIAALREIPSFRHIRREAWYELQMIADVHDAVAALHDAGDTADAAFLINVTRDLDAATYAAWLLRVARSPSTPRAILQRARNNDDPA